MWAPPYGAQVMPKWDSPHPAQSVDPAGHTVGPNGPLVCGVPLLSLDYSILTIAILDVLSQKWPYLDERVELILTLATNLVRMVHLESMANCDNANANVNFG